MNHFDGGAADEQAEYAAAARKDKAIDLALLLNIAEHDIAELAATLDRVRALADESGPYVAVRDLRAVLDAEEDPWCRDESCRHRHWRSGSMPTHRRGDDCPTPGGAS